MKKIKSALSLALSLILIIGIFPLQTNAASASGESGADTEVVYDNGNGILYDKNYARLIPAGGEMEIKLNISDLLPGTKWKSLNTNIAIVKKSGDSYALIRGVRAGETEIQSIYSFMDGTGSLAYEHPMVDNTKIHVADPLTSLTMPKQVVLTVGSSQALGYTVSPDSKYSAVVSGLKFESSDPEAVEVDKDGKLTPKKAGTAVITATTNEFGKNLTGTTLVTVTDKFTYTKSNGNAVITGYNGTETDIPVPASVDGYTVTEISPDYIINSKAKSISIPGTVKKMSKSTFPASDSFVIVCKKGSYAHSFAKQNGIAYTAFDYKIQSDNTLRITAYEGSVENLRIPRTIDGYSVSSIAPKTFSSNAYIKNVEIPGSVRRLEDETFVNCPNLLSATIAKEVSQIDDEAFSNCPKLAAVSGYSNSEAALYAAKNLYSFSDLNFVYRENDDGTVVITGYNGKKYSGMSIPDVINGKKVSYIANYAFGYSTDGYSFTPINRFVIYGIPGSAAEAYANRNSNIFFYDDSLIANPASYGWEYYTLDSYNLVNYNGSPVFAYIPLEMNLKGRKRVEAVKAFANKYDLVKFEASDNVEEIGTMACYGDRQLQTVIISGAYSIGKEAFAECPKLKSVVIPAYTKIIGSQAFGYVDGKVIEDFVIYGYSGTAGERYAKNNNITFVDLRDSDIDPYSEIVPKSIRLNESELTLDLKNKYWFELFPICLPIYTHDTVSYWKSSNEGVAKVENGIVTAVAPGTATVTVKTKKNFTASCKVTVLGDTVLPESVSLRPSSLSLTVGGESSLTATVEPSNATDKTVKWTSSAPGVAKVNNGKVTAVAAGKAVITAETVNGKKATCEVTVTNPVVNPTSISLKPASLSLTVGGESSLTATVEPSNATDKTVKWTSSAPGVAKVSNGKVTAVAAGKAVITAETVNGKKAACEVVVSKSSYVPVYSKITMSGNGAGNWLNGEEFNMDSQQNVMKMESDGIYKIAFNNVSMNEEMQFWFFMFNDDFTDVLGFDGTGFAETGKNYKAKYGGKFIKCAVPDKPVDITVTLDMTEYNADTKQNAVYRIDIQDHSDSQTAAKTGDVNRDGKINGLDAGLLTRYTSGWDGYITKIKSMEAADINGDGMVNGADAGLLARYTSGWNSLERYFK